MTNLLLRLVFFQSILPLITSELVIDVQPDIISAEITAQLVINCSITNNQVQHLEVIRSLTLSRYNQTLRDFEDITALDLLTLNLKQLVKFKHSEISFGNVFISLTLLYPTQLDANVYRCSVKGGDPNKKDMSLFSKKAVEYETNSTALIEEIRRYKIDENKCLCSLTSNDSTSTNKKWSPPISCRNVINKDERTVVVLASGLKVMCDTKTDGGGWVIFQRRINGKVDFYRGWKEYRDGFGDYNIGEFYLGNENIFKLTSTGKYDLRIDLILKNQAYYAQYSIFQILSEKDNYKINVGGYSGNAGDSLWYHNDMYFSTFDNDNDKASANCAVEKHGAWWYKICYESNLNGKWGSSERGKEVNWNSITETARVGVSFTEMKIRERE